MDLNSHSTQKQENKRLTQDQLMLLEKSFNTNHNLNTERKLKLAQMLGLPPRKVAIWYQNRRARQKTHTIELDYKTLQLELDNVLAEKTRLEKEVDILRHQLDTTRSMLLQSNPSAAIRLPSGSSCIDEDHASSNCPANMTFSHNDDSIFIVEELYSCLIGPQGQPHTIGAVNNLLDCSAVPQ
ncbi:homeobox-leucine zipper protein ATHB-52-like [Carica papaya]|uniref:homeobox-leucine zipper protein ATHB-52-like n=1 Tax=Carica papaya TaxID=3649 RepID=UPI000B8C9DE1|nr:homeobox-leucine zipper protein ATHB-52-like [Carica papaya]